MWPFKRKAAAAVRNDVAAAEAVPSREAPWRVGDVEVDWLGGNCPVQAEGRIHGKPFYFRARGRRWSIGIGGDPVGAPEWYYEEPYGDHEYAAGWMSEEDAAVFILTAERLYRSQTASTAASTAASGTCAALRNALLAKLTGPSGRVIPCNPD